jgi:hypothetical protein
MAVALDRVRWALTYPRRHGQDDWDGRLGRALTALHKAWAAHGARAEARMAEMADPTELPFTATARRAAELRREHRELGKEARALCRALRRTPSLYQACFSQADRGRARRRLAVILRRVEALADAVGRHLSAERDLPGAEPHLLLSGQGDG